MESAIMFQPGTYYVGDLGLVLPNDDLRLLFAWTRDGVLKTGYKVIEEAAKKHEWSPLDIYWVTPLPSTHGTLYGSQNEGLGFDWGCFGVLPWEWVTCSGSHENNKIEFTEPFTCSVTEDTITIGHLHFTFNPK